MTSTSGTGTVVGDFTDYTTVSNPWLVSFSNPFAWKFYELFGVSGTGGAVYMHEIFFKILGLE